MFPPVYYRAPIQARTYGTSPYAFPPCECRRIEPEVIAAPPLRGPNSLKTAIRMDFTRDPRLSSCPVPTLVLWGIEDKVNRPSGGAALQKTMPACDLYLFCKTGHWVQWERAEEFNAVVTSYLAVRTPVSASPRSGA